MVRQALVLALFVASPALHAGSPSCLWSGNSSTSSNWSDPANWSPCPGPGGAPGPGQTLIFPAGAQRTSNTNDFPALALHSILVSGPLYQLGGNAITLSSGFTSNYSAAGGGGTSVATPITLSAPIAFTCAGDEPLRFDGGISLGAFNITLNTVCDIALNAAVDGSGSLTKLQAGSAVLAGSNTYTGTTTVNEGTLRAVGPAPLAGNVVVVAGAQLVLEGGVTGAGALSLGGTAGGPSALRASGGESTWSGPITLVGNPALQVDGGTDLVSNGVLGGNAVLIKVGEGRLVLNGINTYAGPTLVDDGTLQVGSSEAFGAANQPVTVNNGGVLELRANTSVAGRLLVLRGAGSGGAGFGAALIADGASIVWSGAVIMPESVTMATPPGASLLLSGAMSGDADLTKIGAGELVLAGANSYTGYTHIDAGTLRATHAQALGTTAVSTFVNGGTLVLDGGFTSGEDVILNYFAGFSTSVLRGVGTPTLTGQAFADGPSNVDAPAANDRLTLASVVGNDLIKTGAGTLVLTGANSYSGLTDIREGVLSVNHADALGASNGATQGTQVQDGATLRLAGVEVVTSEQLVLNGSGVGGIGALHASTGTSAWTGLTTLASDSAIGVAFGATLTPGSTSGSGGLTKVGPGTLSMLRFNSYTGPTTIAAGVLRALDFSALGFDQNVETATTVANGAQLQLSGGIGIGMEALTLNGNGPDGSGALRNLAGDNSWTGPLGAATASSLGVDADMLTWNGNSAASADLTKVGPGTLVLASANYAGSVFIAGGALLLNNGTLGDVTIHPGTSLSGAGTAGHIELQDGGLLAPEQVLGAASLDWTEGGEIALKLGPVPVFGDSIALAGALQMEGDGPFVFRFSGAASGMPTPGTTYPLIGYASTHALPNQFAHSYEGIPGRHALRGRYLVDAAELDLVLDLLSVFYDDFESLP